MALVLKRDLPFTQMPDIPGVEAVWCKVHLKCKSVNVGAVYRPPNAETVYLDLLFDYMYKYVYGSMIILAGDFNCPLVNWNTLSSTDATSNAMYRILFTLELVQIVREPTRAQGSSNSILDLVFVSNYFRIDDCKVEVSKGISDHETVLCTLFLPNLGRQRGPTKYVRAFNRANDAAVMTYLIHEFNDFYDLYVQSIITVDALWVQFKEHVMHCITNFIPLKKKATCKHNPWITREIIHMKRKINRLRQRNRQRPNLELKVNIISLTKQLKNKVLEARKRFCGTTLNNFIKNSPAKFWRYLNRKNVTASSPTRGKQQADSFNNYFQSIFTADNGVLGTLACYSNESTQLSGAPVISVPGILSLLLNLDERKSCGPDGIPNCFLRRYAEPISEYLYLIFSKSLQDSCLPAEWKVAKIVPIHKSGDVTSPSNYRPISLTCTCCKILEHILLKFLKEHTETKNIIHQNQHGFRAGLSTVTQLAEIFHDLAEGINHQSQTDIIFLDYSKAFDRVAHAKLNFKLNKILGDGPVTRWIASYLSERRQYVQYNDHASDIVPVISGVPQGSVLAPFCSFYT